MSHCKTTKHYLAGKLLFQQENKVICINFLPLLLAPAKRSFFVEENLVYAEIW